MAGMEEAEPSVGVSAGGSAFTTLREVLVGRDDELNRINGLVSHTVAARQTVNVCSCNRCRSRCHRRNETTRGVHRGDCGITGRIDSSAFEGNFRSALKAMRYGCCGLAN